MEDVAIVSGRNWIFLNESGGGSSTQILVVVAHSFEQAENKAARIVGENGDHLSLLWHPCSPSDVIHEYYG